MQYHPPDADPTLSVGVPSSLPSLSVGVPSADPTLSISVPGSDPTLIAVPPGSELTLTVPRVPPVAYDTVPYILVAASDAPQDVRNQTPDEYVCDGTDDDVQIQAAIDALPTNGGVVVLSSGTFTCGSTITLDGAGERLIGQGQNSTLVVQDGDRDCINVGGDATSNAGNSVENMLIEVPDGAAAGIALEVRGVQLATFRNLICRGGVYGLQLRHATRYVLDTVDVREYESAGFHILEGDGSEHVTLGTWVNCSSVADAANVRCFQISVIGGQNAFEVSRHAFIGCKFDGEDNSGVRGLWFNGNGMESSTFTSCGFQDNPTACIDFRDLGTENARILFESCTFQGNSTTETANAFLMNDSNIWLTFINTSTNECTNVFNISGGSPTITIEGTWGNFNNSSAELVTSGGATPTIKNSTDEFIVTQNSGTGSITSGGTTDVITHGLDVTPSAQDIVITLTEDPTNTPGAIWVDTIGSTTFTVNCENDPGASNLDFGWRVLSAT